MKKSRKLYLSSLPFIHCILATPTIYHSRPGRSQEAARQPLGPLTILVCGAVVCHVEHPQIARDLVPKPWVYRMNVEIAAVWTL